MQNVIEAIHFKFCIHLCTKPCVAIVIEEGMDAEAEAGPAKRRANAGTTPFKNGCTTPTKYSRAIDYFD